VVPVLVHDGGVIPESTVICEYAEEASPAHPIYPAERAQVRLRTKAVDEELHRACSAITYVVSHRHTIPRNDPGGFEDFLARGGREGVAARTLKWQWIQQGLAVPGAADKIRLCNASYSQWAARRNASPGSGRRAGRLGHLLDEVLVSIEPEKLALLAVLELLVDRRLSGNADERLAVI